MRRFSALLLLSAVTAMGCSDADGRSEARSASEGGEPSSTGAGGTEGGENGAGSSTSGSGGSDGGGTGGAGSGGGYPVVLAQCDPMEGETVVRTFSPALFSAGGDPSNSLSCTDVLNPERGIFNFQNLRGLGSVSNLRSQGYTLIYGRVLIDDYRDKDIDQDLLDTLSANFAKVRAAGIKVLPRFYYADDGTSPDAPLARVLAHIEQLTPVLQDNADVIAALHGGFVGAWGEWHASSNDLTDPDARKAIFDGLLEALPSSRMVLARRPSHKEVAYGGPLTEDNAYDQSSLARIGHLNDCFLASADDVGTYQASGEKDYAIADSEFTAVGGETCGVNAPRSECPSAMAEMALHHWSFINTSYHQDVLDSWKDDGCYETITCRLGYRFALLGHETPQSVTTGNVLSVSLSVLNDGYARPFNPRPVQIVLDGPQRIVLPVDVDPRSWEPGQQVDLCVGVSVPDDAAPGSYQIGIAMPDAAASLEDDERYAIRLSNDVTWTGGVNVLDATVTIAN